MTYVTPDSSAGLLRLHLNEQTAGCSPAVLSAIRALERESFSCYPDYTAVTAKAADWLGVPIDCVLLTNGLDEGLHVVAQWARRVVLNPAASASVVIVEPAFEMYAACAEAAGLGISRVLPEPDFSFPLARVLSAISPETRLIYLNDPNNPTGLPIPDGQIEQVAAAAPHAIVLVDEAYAEFSGRTCAPGLPNRRRNVVVGRTFAKAHGLAGLRIGALMGAAKTIAQLRPLLSPFSINICAATALETALGDRAYLDWYVAQADASKRAIYAFATRRDIPFWRSEGNYVLLRVGNDASQIVAALAARGILIRDRSRLPGCSGCIRITAGVVAATERCLKELEGILASRTN